MTTSNDVKRLAAIAHRFSEREGEAAWIEVGNSRFAGNAG